MNNYNDVLKEIEEFSRNYSEKKLKKLAPLVIEVLLISLRKGDEFEISISAEMWQKCSVVKHDFEEIHVQVELKQKNTYYELHMLFYNAGLVSHKHRLSGDEEKIIPAGLKKLMSIVKDLEKNVVFSTSSIDVHEA